MTGWRRWQFEADCSRKTALKCWDKVFSATEFSNRLPDAGEDQTKAVAAAVLPSGLLKDLGAIPAVRGRRLAA